MKFLLLLAMAALAAGCTDTVSSEEAVKVWAGPGGHSFGPERSALDAEVLSRGKSACAASTTETDILECTRQRMTAAFDVSHRGADNCAKTLPQADWMSCVIDGNAIATTMELGDRYSKQMLPSDWQDLNAARAKLVTEIKVRSFFTPSSRSYDSGRFIGSYRLDTADALNVPPEMSSRCTGADVDLITFCLVEAHSIIFIRKHIDSI